MQYINNCALTESSYALMQSIPKCEQIPGSSEVLVSTSSFDDHTPEWADFAVVHDSPSIGAGPGIALFRNSKASDKVLFRRAAIKRVTWQLHSKFLCSFPVHVIRWSWNTLFLALKTLVSYHFICISLQTVTLAKTDAEIFHTHAYRLIVASLLSFLWSTGKMSGGLLTCA